MAAQARQVHGTRLRLCAALLAVAVAGLWAGGCRESRSEDPPVHLNLNMDHQAYYEAQEAADLMVDGYRVFEHPRAMRGYVEGTVAAGADDARVDTAYYAGKVGDGYLTSLPEQLTLNEALVRRGESRFKIYCTPCHDATGSGNGLVVQRGFTPPPSFHDETRRSYPVGKLYEVITKGGEAMPSFASQIPVRDRWAVAVYLRSLQFSHGVSHDELPNEVRSEVAGAVAARRAGQMAGQALRGLVRGASQRSTTQLPGGANP